MGPTSCSVLQPLYFCAKTSLRHSVAETPSDSEPNTETREGVWSRYRNLREAYRLCVSSQNAFINSVKIFLAADVIQEEPAAPDSGAQRAVPTAARRRCSDDERGKPMASDPAKPGQGL